MKTSFYAALFSVSALLILWTNIYVAAGVIIVVFGVWLSALTIKESEKRPYLVLLRKCSFFLIAAVSMVPILLLTGSFTIRTPSLGLVAASLFIPIAALFFARRKEKRSKRSKRGKPKKSPFKYPSFREEMFKWKNEHTKEAETAEKSLKQPLKLTKAERPKKSGQLEEIAAAQVFPTALQAEENMSLEDSETESAAPIQTLEKLEEEKISDGIEETFFESGKIRSEIPYKDGKKEGTQKHYYENGRVRLSSPYKNGLIDGIEREYNEEGILIRETRYNDGEKRGVEKLCHPNGRVRSSIRYSKNEKREGEARFYDEHAKILAEVDYSDDKPISGFKADKTSGKKKALSAQELEKYI
jgi:antitoxin component YwqK of YwqJK toxin-antitoxin module